MKRILLLPGLGDVHWVLLKLRSWLARMGWNEVPELHIWNIDGRPRTVAYFDFIPWIKAGTYHEIDLKANKVQFDSLYMRENPSDCILGFQGFDALIATNGNMRNGVPWSRIMGGASTDPGYGPVLSKSNFGQERGNYFVLCFSGFGMFKNAWCRPMPAKVIQKMIDDLKLRFPNHQFVFTGCSWDDEFTRQIIRFDDHYIVGETTLPQLLSLLVNSSGFIGWCGGNSIVAQHLGVKTVSWWSSRYFPKHDRTGWATGPQLVLEVENFHLERTVEEISKFFS